MEEALTSFSLGTERENGVPPPCVGASLLLSMAGSFLGLGSKDFLQGETAQPRLDPRPMSKQSHRSFRGPEDIFNSIIYSGLKAFPLESLFPQRYLASEELF